MIWTDFDFDDGWIWMMASSNMGGMLIVRGVDLLVFLFFYFFNF